MVRRRRVRVKRRRAPFMEGKGFDEREAHGWISLAGQRRADGAGLSLAIADRETGEAVGMVGLLARPAPGTVPVAASAASDRAGLVFQPEPGTVGVGVGYWVLEEHAVAGWPLGPSPCSRNGMSLKLRLVSGPNAVRTLAHRPAVVKLTMPLPAGAAASWPSSRCGSTIGGQPGFGVRR